MKTKIIRICFVVLLISFANFLLGNGTKDTPQEAEKTIPSRIVSLGPAATEILFAIGAGNQVIARTDFCNYPFEVNTVDSLGGFDGKTFSIESVIAKKPDFVYLYKGMHDHLIPMLEKYKIPFFVSNALTINDVLSEILIIGTITGHEDNAKELVNDINNSLSLINLTNNSPTVYWEVWNAPFMTIGKSSFINDLINTAGGKNIFADTEQAYPMVSEESIIARDPDVIFIPSDSPVTIDDVKNRTGWSSISAVKNNKIYKVDADISSRAGPRVKDAVLLINKAFN